MAAFGRTHRAARRRRHRLDARRRHLRSVRSGRRLREKLRGRRELRLQRSGRMTKRLVLPVLGDADSRSQPIPHKPQRALLLGPIQQENLALQYLAAAARRAGHEARVVAYSYRADLDAALRTVLVDPPDLVGLG